MYGICFGVSTQDDRPESGCMLSALWNPLMKYRTLSSQLETDQNIAREMKFLEDRANVCAKQMKPNNRMRYGMQWRLAKYCA